jgi:hypothetical protein
MMRLALIGVKGDFPRAERVASQLMSGGYVREAIDLLFLTGNWKLAVQKLVAIDRLAEVRLICRVQMPSDQKKRFVLQIAGELFDADKLPIAFAVFAESGMKEAVIGKLRELGDNDQAFLFSHDP